MCGRGSYHERVHFDASQIIVAVLVVVAVAVLYLVVARNREYRSVRFGIFLERRKFDGDRDDETDHV